MGAWTGEHYRRFLLGRQVLRHGEHGVVDEREERLNAALCQVFGPDWRDPEERQDFQPNYDRYGVRLDREQRQAV